MHTHPLSRSALSVLIFIVGSALSSRAAEKAIPPDEVLHDQEVTIFQYEKYGMTIVAIPGSFDFLYQSKGTATVKRVAKRHGYRYVVNGSYFHPDRTHAGWLSMNGRVYSEKITDPQLTHVVSYDTKSVGIHYTPASQFTPDSKQGIIEFQTGPLVIDNGRLARGAIKKSVNGPGSYRRTLLATTDLRNIHFITVRTRVSLDTLASFLLKASVFSGKRLDVVNLDGGSSVALWAKNFPRLNFNEDADLPVLLGVR